MANENKVLSFIDEVNKEKATIAKQNAFMSSPIYKKKQLDDNMLKAKSDCLNYIFADLYKNSLPLEDSYVYANDEKLTNDMKDFINKQTADKGVECYVREAIKRGNKSLAQIMESVEHLVNTCFKEKVADYKRLDVKDLDWKFDDVKRAELKQIAADANLDEVANYIKQNVKSAAEYEKAKIIEKHQEAKEIQEEMEKNNELTSESAIMEYMKLHGKTPLEKAIYQPSLFEGVMINKFNHLPSETIEEQGDCYNEAVGEFTMLNINKAMRYKNYPLRAVQELAKEYARA